MVFDQLGSEWPFGPHDLTTGHNKNWQNVAVSNFELGLIGIIIKIFIIDITNTSLIIIIILLTSQFRLVCARDAQHHPTHLSQESLPLLLHHHLINKIIIIMTIIIITTNVIIIFEFSQP